MRATILCYHKVGPIAEEGRRLNIEPRRLETHVRYFARRRQPFLLARDLVGGWPRGTVVFTFDDAYLSTMRHAPDVFERHGVRATFYAVPGRVGTSSDWDGPAARPLATWDSLREAAARGHEIGNHTFDHPHLAGLTDEEQFQQIARADARLRAEGFNPRSFCYPYGSLDASAMAAVRRAGYGVAVALGKQRATRQDDHVALPRVVVAYSDALPMLLYKAHLRPLMRRRWTP